MTRPASPFFWYTIEQQPKQTHRNTDFKRHMCSTFFIYKIAIFIYKRQDKKQHKCSKTN